MGEYKLWHEDSPMGDPYGQRVHYVRNIFGGHGLSIQLEDPVLGEKIREDVAEYFEKYVENGGKDERVLKLLSEPWTYENFLDNYGKLHEWVMEETYDKLS